MKAFYKLNIRKKYMNCEEVLMPSVKPVYNITGNMGQNETERRRNV